MSSASSSSPSSFFSSSSSSQSSSSSSSSSSSASSSDTSRVRSSSPCMDRVISSVIPPSSTVLSEVDLFTAFEFDAKSPDSTSKFAYLDALTPTPTSKTKSLTNNKSKTSASKSGTNASASASASANANANANADVAWTITRSSLFRLRDHFTREGRISESAAVMIAQQAKILMTKEPNLIRLKTPLTVCGDIHGQFYDLLRAFERGGDPGQTQYLFLGDYVDRGEFSCEVILYLLACKIAFPSRFFLLRGNHEDRKINHMFNFEQECRVKYSASVFDSLIETFLSMPIAATINKNFLAVHGGISPDIQTLDDILLINRFVAVPESGALCDLLWADPLDENDSSRYVVSTHADAKTKSGFKKNANRGCSYTYDIDAVTAFLARNKLLSIVRAHETPMDGYKMHMVNKKTGMPRCITVFSAPNYCNTYGNEAACLRFENDFVIGIQQFKQAEAPYLLPDFQNVFDWSIDFLVSHLNYVAKNILKVDEDEDAVCSLSSYNGVAPCVAALRRYFGAQTGAASWEVVAPIFDAFWHKDAIITLPRATGALGGTISINVTQWRLNAARSFEVSPTTGLDRQLRAEIVDLRAIREEAPIEILYHVQFFDRNNQMVTEVKSKGTFKDGQLWRVVPEFNSGYLALVQHSSFPSESVLPSNAAEIVSRLLSSSPSLSSPSPNSSESSSSSSSSRTSQDTDLDESPLISLVLESSEFSRNRNNSRVDDQ